MSAPDKQGGIFRVVPNELRPTKLMSQPVKASPTVTTEKQTPPATKRRVYVLHSGMDDPTDEAANRLKQGLLKRGIAERDIVVLSNTYPSRDLWQAASNNQQEPNSVIFRASTDPDSRVTKDVFKRYHETLTQRGVKPKDERTWVGHSAGGQMGMTVSRLAKSEGKFPIDTLITLGSPLHREARAPETTRMRNYVSSQDEWVNMKSEEWLSRQIGVPITVTPPQDFNDKLRLFSNVPHTQWYKDARVLDRIVSESDPAYKPAWQVQQESENRFVRWMGNLNQHMDEIGHVTLEGLQPAGLPPKAPQKEVLISKQP